MDHPTGAIGPEDVIAAAASCRAALAPALGGDWSGPAGDLDWDCRRTLDHVADALLLYAAHLAMRATSSLPHPRNGDASRTPAELLTVVEGIAAVLAEVARAAPPDVRGFHGAGMADPEGFLAMGCEEILIHTADIAQGLGHPFRPSDELAGRVLRRLFPWAPTDEDPWVTLRWASGRAPLGDRPRLGPDWYWHCAPLAEWDGTVKTRARPPGWT